MAKKTKKRQGKQRAAKTAVEPSTKLPEVIVRAEKPAPEPARAPVFWFGFEVAWAKLAIARFVIFILLAIDAVMQLSHAPRYGASDFNVGQLPFLGELAPGRIAFGVAQLLMAYAFTLVAFGIATRVLVPIGAAVYAWVYFTSQLDSYQHHYLVALLLVIACFVPWRRPEDATPETPVRSWAVRLILVQLAIMYVWAAISKMHPAWIDGTTLGMQMTGTLGSAIAGSIGFKVAAVLIIATELVLAATVWTRPAWLVAAPVGIAFHFGIVLTGLEIGLFAFLMLGIYVLIVPDRVWIAIAGPFDRFAQKLAGPSWAALGLGVVAGIAVARLVRFEDAFLIALGACAVPLGVALYAVGKQRVPAIVVGVAHVAAILMWLAIDRVSSVTVDYYRFWGGSQRRIGSPAVAEHAYRRLTEVAPDNDSGHYQLGKLLLKRGAVDDGITHLREAQRLAPAKARAFVEEALHLRSQNKIAEAIEKAKQATYADPSDAHARALLDSLTGKAKEPVVEPDESE